MPTNVFKNASRHTCTEVQSGTITLHMYCIVSVIYLHVHFQAPVQYVHIYMYVVYMYMYMPVTEWYKSREAWIFTTGTSATVVNGTNGTQYHSPM